jgi:hypothetical protein
MKTRIMYVECKADRNDRGGARICRVTITRTGRTVRYRGLVLHRAVGIGANFYDENTGLPYWVSGPKKNGQDRHWAGTGPVRIDPDVVEEYWRDIRRLPPPKNPYLTWQRYA